MTKKQSWFPIIFILALSWIVLGYWDKWDFLKQGVHDILDPSLGALINWNLTLGMAAIVFLITLITTIVQKYATDQNALKELREEQKLLQKEMKKYENNPEKMMEFSKKQWEVIPKTMKLTGRATLYTGVPFILLFRWFADIFTQLGEPKFFGFVSWFWFYFICAMIFSSILRKYLKVL